MSKSLMSNNASNLAETPQGAYCQEYYEWLDKVEIERMAAHEVSDAEIQSAEEFVARYIDSPFPVEHSTDSLSLHEVSILIPMSEIPY